VVRPPSQLSRKLFLLSSIVVICKITTKLIDSSQSYFLDMFCAHSFTATFPLFGNVCKTDWVPCVEWEALERKLAMGARGHDSHVSFWCARYFRIVGRHLILGGPNMGSQDRKAYQQRAKKTHKMDHVFILGTNTHIGGCVSSVTTFSAGC
jgi:hypothetical protein